MSENGEITLDELLVKGMQLVFFFKKHLVFLLVFVAVAIGVGLYLRPEAKFVARTTIMFDDEKSGGGILGIAASQFGLGGDSKMSGKKLDILIASKNIKKRVLSEVVDIEGKKDVLGHHILEKFKIREEFDYKPELANVSLLDTGFYVDLMYDVLIGRISPMIEVNVENKELALVKVMSSNEHIAYHVCSGLEKAVNEYILESSMGADILNQQLIENKIDSIKAELYVAENRYASLKDNSIQVVKSKGYIDLLRTERQISILNGMYIEAIKQLEILNFKIKTTSSSLDVIDRPHYPLVIEQKSIMVVAIMGTIVGGMVGVLLLGIFTLFKHLQSLLRDKKEVY